MGDRDGRLSWFSRCFNYYIDIKMNMLTYIKSFYLTKSSSFSSDVKRNETIYAGSKITGTTMLGVGQWAGPCGCLACAGPH